MLCTNKIETKMLLYLSIIDIFYFNKYQFENVSLYGFIIIKQLKIFFCEQLLGKITLLKDKIILLKLV